MWKVKIRRCPNVPLGVSTIRALISSGRLVGTGPAASGASTPALRALSRAAFALFAPLAAFGSFPCFMEAGANNRRFARRVSSVRRSMPTRWCAAARTPDGSDGKVPGAVTSAPDSKTRHGTRVSWVAPLTL